MEKERTLWLANSHDRLVINGLGVIVISDLRKDYLVVTRVSSSCGDHKVSTKNLSQV